ncbi:GIY-YIG nuclease family protein [Actinokineospora inagensis]|uniref:GIY-YIG nuclease family protein n=1 Tax=Actinokineospora inagensis TaxID=103730 RepID=UPI00040EE791|nr:GIY-YIG nuclease family protein [Actinokineospora inagensis]
MTEPTEAAERPPQSVHDELRSYLEQDESRLGDVYRGQQAGQSPDEIAAALNVATSNFVWNYTQIIKALLEGRIPGKPSMAMQVARRLRAIAKQHHLTEPTRVYLSARLAVLELQADDVPAREAEDEQALRFSTTAESRKETGVYVYALPHYLRYPYDPATGHTLLKVGRSARDIMERVQAQGRTTALPEDPILLRIYRAGAHSPEDLEKKFHYLLKSADHSLNVSRVAGKEWFLTTTRFLDAIARTLEVEIVVVNDIEDF